MPYQVFAASDGHLIVAVGNDSQFRNYCGVIGLPELSADPRFSTNPQRVKNREELVPLLAERMATGARDHWLAALEGVGVPAGPINTLDQVYEDPQVLARGMKRELPHPAAGKVPMAASPLNLSGSPVEYRRAPPMLGEHTAQVLFEKLGLSADEIQALAGPGLTFPRGRVAGIVSAGAARGGHGPRRKPSTYPITQIVHIEAGERS